jgi:hypothetical protein
VARHSSYIGHRSNLITDEPSDSKLTAVWLCGPCPGCCRARFEAFTKQAIQNDIQLEV